MSRKIVDRGVTENKLTVYYDDDTIEVYDLPDNPPKNIQADPFNKPEKGHVFKEETLRERGYHD